MMRKVKTEIRVLRNGAYLTTLRYAPNSAPTIRCDDTGAIKSALTGSFQENRDVDWLSDELQPVLTIDGEEHTIGVFVPVSVEENRTETGTFIDVEAYDRGWRLQAIKARIYYTLYSLDDTYTYLFEVKQLLSTANIAIVLCPPDTSPRIPEMRSFELGTDYLTIANTLLKEINFDELFFNKDGAAVLQPYKTPSGENVTRILDNSNIRSLVLPNMRRISDIYNKPNEFVVVCANPDRGEMLRAVAVNTNPQSPFSTLRRGRRITEIVRMDYIADQAALQAYANRLCSMSMLSGETVTVETALLPGFGYHDVTGLRYDEISGVFLERGWSMDFRAGGTMTHHLERVVVNLG